MQTAAGKGEQEEHMFSAYFESSAFRDNPFVFRSEMNILLERDIGIAGEKGTVLTPPENWN